MNLDQALKSLLGDKKEVWLVTGVAGFIGSHIAQALIRNGQTVNGLDNFSTGKRANIDLLHQIEKESEGKFSFFEGSITVSDQIKPAFQNVTKVIHQAALGSVPRSIDNPSDSHAANVTGFINVLNEAKDLGIKRVVYASSSSVYGDAQDSPKVESRVGKVLSPYAATKMCNEVYADSYSVCYDMEFVGLRYFNVFGARQDPDGPYAAVIPKWIDNVQKGELCTINGDGETSRDFCYIDNVVYANIASSLTPSLAQPHTVLNVACGEKTSLNELYNLIADNVKKLGLVAEIKKPEYGPFRPGDIRHSLADISLAKQVIDYKVFVAVHEGIARTVKAYFGKA